MKTIKCFLVLKILLFNFLFFNSSLSKDLFVPNSIEFELSNSEYNKYLRRSMRAYTDGEIYGEKNIKKKYKKWIKAKLLSDNKKIDSEIRILGDWKDHLRPPLTSLKVKVLDNSFNGVTRFNLFLPETRKGENEVFWTLMLKYLGFPSLYTRIIDVNLNGNIYKAIFQEDATKEFLERNNFTETVILKSNDFQFYLDDKEKQIYNNFFSSSFVIDNNNFLKNNIANFITSEAIALKANLNFSSLVFQEDFFTSIHKKYAKHGLATINRKYIYIPYKKIFVPLYYDGNVQFLPGKTNCQNQIDPKILSNFKKDFSILAGKKLSKMQECVLGDIMILRKNNDKQLKNFFPSFTSDNEKNTKYIEIKNKILNYFENNSLKKEDNIEETNLKTINYTFLFNDKYYKCYLDIINNKISTCIELDSLAYSKLISESGRYKLKNDFKSFPINLGTFNNETPIIFLNGEANEFVIDKKGTFYLIKQDKKDENLKFILKNNEAKVFIQGNFENVEFDFQGDFFNEKEKGNDIRYDKNLLTGCVNFFDSKFKEIKLKSSNMICEDSVNIKNSVGTINKIDIQNSFYDALDLDFSKIKINDLIVENAKNDCADFSFGNYEIINANLSNCGDKGFSVGERSKLKLDNGKIMFSNIGVASKDDAITNISNVNIKNINVCLAAYNKKKEFKGSKININNLNCLEYQKLNDVDTLSEINIIKKN